MRAVSKNCGVALNSTLQASIAIVKVRGMIICRQGWKITLEMRYGGYKGEDDQRTYIDAPNQS